MPEPPSPPPVPAGPVGPGSPCAPFGPGGPAGPSTELEQQQMVLLAKYSEYVDDDDAICNIYRWFCDIFMCYKKCTFLTLTIASGRIKPNVVQCFIIFSRFGIIEIKPNVPVFESTEIHVRNVLHFG